MFFFSICLILLISDHMQVHEAPVFLKNVFKPISDTCVFVDVDDGDAQETQAAKVD